MKRREFIKLSSLLSAGAVASPSFLLGGCAAKPLPGTGKVTATPTICDMCFWKCAGNVYKEDGELWKIKGNPEDLHSGGRLCTRGTGGQGIGLVVFQNIFRLFQGPLVNIGAARGRPVLAHVAVDQFGLGLAAHVPVGTFMAEKIFSHADFPDDIRCQGFIVHRDSLNQEFNHAGELIVHYHLAIINGHAHFDHPQAVNQVGTCQRR